MIATPRGLRVAYVVLGTPLHAAGLLLPLAIAGRLGEAAEPARLAFLVLASALFLADLPTIRPTPPVQPPDDPATDRLALATGLLLFAGFEIGLLGTCRTGLVASAIGGLGMAVGVALRLTAVLTLGAAFVTGLTGDGELVDRGLFARLRHPSEAGNLAVALGAGLLLGSPWALGLAVLGLAPMVLLRVRREEVALRGRYGGRYRDYAGRVGGLWPRPSRRPVSPPRGRVGGA